MCVCVCIYIYIYIYIYLFIYLSKNFILGQLYQIADELYNTKLSIKVLEEENALPGAKKVLVKFRLDFDNRDFVFSRSEKKTSLERLSLPAVPCNVLMTLFPFGIVFGEDMHILAAGEKLLQVCGASPRAILGKLITDYFRLRRPRGVPFTWKNVIAFKCFVLIILILVLSPLFFEKPASSSPRVT